MLTHMSPSTCTGKTALRLLLGGVILLGMLSGCSSAPTRILDSDVPQMPEMEQRLGYDIKRRGGDLVGGVFIFIGPLEDMQASMITLASRFRDQGWTLEGESASFPRSSMLFARDDRRVQVIIDADQLEPAMSRAQFQVSLVSTEDSEPGNTEPSGTASSSSTGSSG
jgi:hypothetical protein